MVNSRDKGKRGEREAAAKLNEIFPEAGAKRGIQFRGGQESPDVLHNLEGIHIEVKRTEVFKPSEWAKQAIRDAGTNTPVIMFKPSRGDWWFCVRWDWLIPLVNRLKRFS